MVSIQRMFLASAILHLTVMLAGYRAILKPKNSPKTVEAYQWLVDIGTVLLANELGPSQDPSVKEAMGDDASALDKPAAVPEGNGAGAAARADIKTLSGERPDEVVSQTDKPATGIAGAGDERLAQGNIQLNQAFRNTMSGQMLMIKAGQFIRATNATVYAMLAQTLPIVERKSLEGSRGTVTVAFKDDGGIDSLEINADSKSLREVLRQKVYWNSVPLPQRYMLPYRKVTFDIFLANEKITLKVSPS